MATANAEYPQPLAHCNDVMIRCSCLPVPYSLRAASAVVRARHCATPQGDRYTVVRDRFSLLVHAFREGGEQCTELARGWRRQKTPVPGVFLATSTRQHRHASARVTRRCDLLMGVQRGVVIRWRDDRPGPRGRGCRVHFWLPWWSHHASL